MELIERQKYILPIRVNPIEKEVLVPRPEAAGDNGRMEWIDIARGIAILLVVLGHAVNNDGMQHLLQPFRMPLFYITTGFLFNSRRHAGALGHYLRQRCRRMIVPYFFTAIFFYGMSLVVNDVILGHPTAARFQLFLAIFLGNGAGTNGEDFVLRFNLPLWYLACMTSASILFVGLLHGFRKETSRVPLVIGSLTIALFGYLIGQRLFLPWSFDVAMVAQFFMMIGFLLRENRATFADRRVFLLLMGAYLGLSLTNNYLDMNRRQFRDFGETFVAGLAGTYMLFFLSRQLMQQAAERVSASRLASFFRFFGRHTMVIMSCHFGAYYLIWLVLHFRSRDPFAAPISWAILFPTMVLTSLLAIAVINRFKVLRAIYYK